MSNVEILGKSNLQTIKSRQAEWNRRWNKQLQREIAKQNLKLPDIPNLELIYERYEYD